MPKVSVILPCYNSDAYIGDAIQSILNQTYDNYELIIINDGSSDNSVDIIKSFDDKRIHYVENPKNLGLIQSLNKGIKLAQGEYIARMDADDIAFPNRFEEQVNYLDTHETVSLIGSGYITIPGNKTFVPLESPKIWDMLVRNRFAHPTVMFRKSDFLDRGLLYDENYSSAEDYELWSRALIKGLQCKNLQRVLLKYRQHPKSITATKRQEMTETNQKVKANLLSVLTSDAELQNFLLLVAKASKSSLSLINFFLRLKKFLKIKKHY